MSGPRLSVAMAVHNVLPYVEASVRSILAQTHRDFEFVIGDDGSTDGTSDVLRRLAGGDSRIRLLRRERRSGLSGSANWVVGEARGPLVAIMHGDDLSYPERLEKQAALLERECDALLVGALYDGIDEKGRRVRSGDYLRLTRRSPFAPFCHSSIMFRKAAFERVGGYRPEADYWEDLDLYFRIAGHGRILVVPEVLSSVRFTGMSARLTSQAGRVDQAIDLMYRSVGDYCRGGDYPRRFPPRPEKLSPETFIGRGSVQLWAGRSPQLLKRLLATADLRPDAATLKALVWTLWATLSPRSLRFGLRAMMRLRRMASAPGLEGRDDVEWDPARARQPGAAPSHAADALAS